MLKRLRYVLFAAFMFDWLIGGVSGGLIRMSDAQAVSGITAAGADCTTTNACAIVFLNPNSGAVAVNVSGTWSATLQFEVCADTVANCSPGSASWVSAAGTPPGSSTTATSTTANGAWRFAISGLTAIRVRCSAFTSGTANVNIQQSSTAASISGSAGSGTVTNSGTLTNNAAVFGAGTTVVKTDNAITTDGSGNFTATSLNSTGGAAAGNLQLKNGTAPSFNANNFALFPPASITTAYGWLVPAAAATGLVRGDNSSNTVTLSQSELSGDATTSGSNAVTVVKVNGAAVPTSAKLLSSNASNQLVAAAAATSPVTVSATGAIACATCVTSAASLTSNAVVIGGGNQSSSTISTDTTTTHALFATAGAPAFRALATGDLPATVDINLCTTSPAAGAYTPAGTANAVECLGPGTYTLPNSVTTISNNSSVIMCTSPAAIIARGGAASGIKFSGNQDGLVGCTLDDAATTTTQRFIEMAGTDDFVVKGPSGYVVHQNSSATTGTFPTIDITGGSVRATVDGIRFEGTQTDECIGVNSAATGSITVTEPIIRDVQVAAFGPSTGNRCIDLQQPNTSNIIGADVEDLTISISANNSGTIGFNLLGQVVVESTATYRYKFSHIKIYLSGASGTNVIAYKTFGMNFGTVDDLLIDDNGHVLQGYMAEGDVYHVTRTNIVIKSASSSTTLISCSDCGWDTLTAFSISGLSGNAIGVDYQSVSNPTFHNTTGPGSIKCAGQCRGIRIFGNASGKAMNYNLVTGVDLHGAGTATSTGVLFDIGNSSTGTNNKVVGSTFSGFNGASSIDINVNNAAMSNTYIGCDNNFDNADVKPISDSGTNTVICGIPQRATLTSLYTNATTTFSNVTGVAFNALPSMNYLVTCHFDYQTTATTADVKIQWTGPASPTFLVYDLDTAVTASSLSASVNPATATTTGAFSTALSEAGTPTINTNFPMTLTMTLVNGTTQGIVQLQAAATGTGTISILPGGCQIQ